MLRESGSDSRRLGLAFLALFFLATFFPSLTLFSGQVIKQFETYSLAESISRVGWNPLATTIPCDGGIRWVLELPIYAGIGGVFVAISRGWPAAWPLLVFGAFLFSVFRFRSRLAPESGILGWVAVAATPVFLRFSTQFLADPLALALVILGASFFVESRRRVAFLFFLFAVSVKPTVLPSILFFRFAFASRRDFPSLVREGGLAVLLALPFAAWSFIVKWAGIPSPMHAGGLLAIGQDWGILATRAFYSKFFVWTVFKGVGIPLFLLALYGATRLKDDRIRRLGIWALGIIPYWILVRRLNVIHDYYSLSFFFPIAVMGALAADLAVGRARVFGKIFLVATILQGVGLFIASGVSLPRGLAVSERPVFCGPEFRSEALMGTPPTN